VKAHQAFADHRDVPTSRVWAWNVVAVLVAAGAIYGAARVGHLALFLAVVAAMVAATAVAIVQLSPALRASRTAAPDEVAEEHKRVAAAIADRHLREAA
jgi:hypothetical protein